jgi:hypothetical protein
MAKKILLVVFTIECFVLAVLLCREWTRYYIGGGQAAADYETVYRDKLEAGRHPITADIDAGTTSFVFWWGGTICIFFGVALGGPRWAYLQLWPDHTVQPELAVAPPWLPFEPVDEEEAGWDDMRAEENDLFGDEYEGARAM